MEFCTDTKHQIYRCVHISDNDIHTECDKCVSCRYDAEEDECDF